MNGKELKVFRKEYMDMKQYEFADRFNFSKQAIGNMERGVTPVSHHLVDKILDELLLKKIQDKIGTLLQELADLTDPKKPLRKGLLDEFRKKQTAGKTKKQT